MAKIACFWLEPVDTAVVHFRRYSRENETCKGKYSYHNAVSGQIRVVPHPLEEYDSVRDDLSNHDDPRWPAFCSCGYHFTDVDHWQTITSRFFRRSDTGELVTIDAAPVGAMWDAWWFEDCDDYKPGPEGVILMVRTPSGDWCVDGPTSDNQGNWKRTGTIPKVTATPSIWFKTPGGYHGWLRDGFLEDYGSNQGQRSIGAFHLVHLRAVRAPRLFGWVRSIR